VSAINYQLRPRASTNAKMLSFLTINSIIVLTYVATTLIASASITGAGNMARDTTPLEPFDPNTTKFCSYWWDTEGSFTCQEFVDGWGLTLADFTRWVCPFILSLAVLYVAEILHSRIHLLQQHVGTSKPLVNRTALRSMTSLYQRQPFRL